MPKSKSSSNSNEKKKRKLQLSLDSFQNIANLTGFDHDDDDDEADNNMGGGFGEGSTTTTTTMDDVMAQFQFQQQQQQQPSKGEEKGEDNDTKKPSSSASATAAASSSSSRKQQQQQHHNNLNIHLLDFEKIELWNQAFVKWCSSSSSSSSKSSSKSNNYQPGLLPNIDEEIARNFKVQELSTFLLNTKDDEDEISGGGGVATSDNNSNNNNNIKELRMPTFERWLLDSKFLEQQQQKQKSKQRKQTFFDIYDDPILPSNPKSDTGPSLRLIQELIDSGMYTNKSSAINKVQTLCRNTSVACYELISQKRNRYIKESPLRNGDRIIIEEQEQQEKGNNNNHQDNNNNNNNDASGGNTTMITILYKRKKWKKPFCFKINKTYYDNLKLRFDEIHNNNSNNGKIRTKLPPLFDGNNNNNNSSNSNQRAVNSFNVIILALLLRYSALSGGQLLQNLRGGGMQGSIHSDVFDVLREQKQNLGFGDGEVVLLEGFASPFNVCPSNGIFGSAFSKDLDWHFGSIGSFFDLRFDKIVAAATNNNLCCEVNPPFTPGIMNGMVDHIESSLRKAQKYNNNNNNDLTFVVIVPTATTTTTTVTSATSGKKRNKQKKQKQQHASITTTATTATTTSSIKEEAWKSFNKMISSPYFKRHIHLSARQHGYIEGSQHLRPTKYKQSTYDTSVLILQTTTTTNATNNTNLEELESKIKIAFTSKHEKEIMERREYEKKQRK